MDTLGKWVVDQILRENKVIAIYPGRFQPFGSHHKKVHDWAKRKFGEVHIATSNKVDYPKSPFSFNEKKQIIESYGIRNLTQVRNPYNAQEVLSKFDPSTTSAVYLLGQKDAERLSKSKFFRKWEGKADVGLNDGAYFVVVPHVSVKVAGHELSGTEIRKLLGEKIENKEKIFKAIFGHTDPKIYDLVVSKLEQIHRVLGHFSKFVQAKNIAGKLLREQNITSVNSDGADVDDGPGFMWGNASSYKYWNNRLAKQLGQTVVDWLIGDELINFRDFLTSPKDDFESGEGGDRDAWIPGGVTPPSWYASGISGTNSVGHTIVSAAQEEIYQDWLKHVKKLVQGLGWEFVSYLKDVDLKEDITIPVNVGDTVLGGKFKNKKIVIKTIGKNEKGDITINGKPILKIRLPEKIDELNKTDLLKVSSHKKQINYPIKLKEFKRKQKRLVFEVGKYTCQVQLEDFAVISRLKGNLTEKIKLAMDEDIKVHCNCKDFRYGGAKYNTFQTDAGIYSEKRPPNVKDPTNENFLCKHLKQLLEKIDKKVPK